MKQLVVTVNGPGEISAWLTPLSRAVKAIRPETHIVACLVPCVFSSGAERAVVERIESVDAVASIAESFGLLLKGRRPPGFAPGAESLVLHFGGELPMTRAMAWRLGAPAYTYSEYPDAFLKRFDRVFYNGLTAMPARIGGRATEGIGEMMVDAARAKIGTEDRREPGLVAIVPGSRAYMAEFLLPYFAEAADRIAAKRPDVRFVLPRSDYIDPAWYRDFPNPPEDRDWAASPVTHRDDGGRARFETARGTVIDIASNAEVLARASAAVTIPGTNTGEMAAVGIPMVTVLPTYRVCAEGVPLPGIAGHVARIPFIGKEIKVFAAGRALRSQKLLAIPSRRVGTPIVPELIGQNLHDEIAAAILGLIDDEDRVAARRVMEAMGPPGAAQRLATEIVAGLDALGSRPAAAIPAESA